MKSIETKVFLIFTIIMVPITIFFNDFFSGNYLNQIIVFSLPLLWPGLAHGSLDLLVAKKIGLVKNEIDKFIFLLIYISIPLIFFYAWMVFPNIVFIIFLLLSIYHFGMSDSITNNKTIEILVRGALVIVLPFKFHIEETIEIFSYFYVNEFFLENLNEFFNYIFFILIFLILLCLILNYKKKSANNKSIILILELIGLFFCFWFFEPLISFFIYFCFLHSTRHLIDEQKNLELSNKHLFYKTLPMTFITLIFFIALFIFFQNSPNNLNINLVVIGISSLTVSHIILINFTKNN